MSFLLGVGQALFSGLSSIGSAISSDLQWVTNNINNALGNLSSFVSQLPTEISNFFQTVAGAIIGFAHTLGTFIWDGLQRLASGISALMLPIERALVSVKDALVGTFVTIWNDLKQLGVTIYNAIAGFASNIFQGVQGFVNNIKNMFVNAYNFISTVVSDVYKAFVIISNFFFDMTKFFTNTSDFFNSLFKGFGGQSNLINVIPNLIASEVSRITSAFPDIVAYNTFMEVMPRIINGIANSPMFGGGIRGMMAKMLAIAGSPVISAFISLFTRSIMQNLFTPTMSTQTIERPSHPELRSFTESPSVSLEQRSTPSASVSDINVSQMQPVSTTEIEAELERPNVTGVLVEDVIGMGTPGGGTAELVSGYVNFFNAVHQFEDTFEVVAYFFMKLVQSMNVELVQNVTVDVTLAVLENIYQVNATIEILPSMTSTPLVLAPNMTFCDPSQAPSPGETAMLNNNEIIDTVTIPTKTELCIPPYNLLAGSIRTLFSVKTGIIHNYMDALSLIFNVIADIPLQTAFREALRLVLQIQTGLSFNVNLTDSLSLAYQLYNNLPFGINLTNSFVLSLYFTGSPPPEQTYTVYGASGTQIQYSTRYVATADLSATISYSITIQ